MITWLRFDPWGARACPYRKGRREIYSGDVAHLLWEYRFLIHDVLSRMPHTPVTLGEPLFFTGRCLEDGIDLMFDHN